ncbi:hypothetical protein F5148DRAFT_1372358 [Russula earlei]|uniref:Uncharacterized protein n=1 Tax=Russula earlei TaxID=71964 RepID=A0ACC0TR10_9AGAM|nr:hypothetical protein F5148DRAFT_1372358 [Russula earlei]
MMFIKSILALSFAVLALAAPPVQPRQGGYCTYRLIPQPFGAILTRINAAVSSKLISSHKKRDEYKSIGRSISSTQWGQVPVTWFRGLMGTGLERDWFREEEDDEREAEEEEEHKGSLRCAQVKQDVSQHKQVVIEKVYKARDVTGNETKLSLGHSPAVTGT